MRTPSEAPAVGPDLLVLCTANVCRSPAAAAVLASRLGGAGMVVASAGLAARPGTPADERTRALVPDLPTDFRAQQLTPALLSSARLVLTMTRHHRASAVSLAPATVRRAFTLNEFADLAALVGQGTVLAGDPAERLVQLVQRAPRMRGARSAGPSRPDEIDDPYRLSASGYRAVIDQVVSASREIGDWVLGGRVFPDSEASAHLPTAAV